MQLDRLKNLMKYTKELNVLYVEDNLDVQQQTLKMLSSFFEKIELANNGKVALELFYENKYDLIITDIKMPLVDGIFLIESIRKTDKKIPIIIFSAHDDKDYFLKTINAGIDGYILKPYTLEQITQTLDNLIQKYQSYEEYENKIRLENSFVWDKNLNQLFKNSKNIRLSKYEKKLFELFISEHSILKSYDEIEYFLFNNVDNNTKRIRNLITRLKQKLDYELFETVYSHGYSLKYEVN